MKIFRCVALALVLSGCAVGQTDLAQYLPPDAPAYAPAPAPPQGHALVYIYRLGAYPRLHHPDVVLDEQRIWEPPEHGYTWVHAKEGDRRFQVKWAFSGTPNASLVQPLKAGETYYLKVSGGVDPLLRKFSSNVRFVERGEAEDELRRCCKFIPLGKYNPPVPNR